MTTLALEIRKVLLSPYAVSLKSLEETLKTTGLREYRTWADSHPCQTKALAAAVLNALEFCPYALSVLEQTGRVGAVRDEMLRLKPTLLDALLRNALQDENNFDKYSHACLSLLSTPLPSDFPPPAYLVTFFLRCVDIAAKNTNVDTIKAVYTLVSNGFRYLSELLSPTQSRSFSDQMALFLSIQGQTDTNTLLVLSLATLAHMAIAADSTDPTPSEENARLKSGPVAFFRGKKAQRVLHLITNIVIDAAAKDAADWEHTTELIRMATVIVETVAEPIKQQWCTTKESALLQRLLEKTLRPEMESHVATEVLRFVGVLHAASPLPRLQETFDKLVEKSFDDVSNTSHSLFLPPELASLFITSSSPEPTVRMLRSVFQLASVQPEPTHQVYTIITSRISFLQNLVKRIPRAQNLRCAILGCLITNEFTPIITDFLSSIKARPIATKCQDYEACPSVVLSSQHQLQQLLCTLILQSGIYTQSDTPISLDPVLASTLMEKLMFLSTPLEQCPLVVLTLNNHTHTKDLVIPMFEASATPDVRINSRNWRQSMLEGMTRETDRQHKFVVAAVSEICRDLEKRCETVEQPLRREEERSERLKAALKEVQQRCVELEKEVESKIQGIQDVEQEKMRTENKLDIAIAKTNDSIDRIRALEQALEDSRAEVMTTAREFEEVNSKREATHHEEVKRLRESAHRASLEHMALLNEHIVLLDERQNKIDELEKQVNILAGEIEENDTKIAELDYQLETKDQQIQELRSERQNLVEKVEQLETQSKARLDELEAVKTMLADRDSKIADLDQALDDMVNEEERLKGQIDELNASSTVLETKIAELVKEMEKSEDEHTATHETLVASHAEEISRLTALHSSEKAQLEQTFTTLRDDYTRELSSVRTSLSTVTAEKQGLEQSLASVRTSLSTVTSDKQSLEESLISIRATYKTTLSDLATAQHENRALAKKIHKLQSAQELKEREAKLLTGRLLGLMGGGGGDGFAQLLGGGGGGGRNAMDDEDDLASSLIVTTTHTKTAAVSGNGRGLDTLDSSPVAHHHHQQAPHNHRRRTRAAAAATNGIDLDVHGESPGKPTPKRTKTRQSNAAPPPVPPVFANPPKHHHRRLSNGSSSSTSSVQSQSSQRVMGFRTAKAVMMNDPNHANSNATAAAAAMGMGGLGKKVSAGKFSVPTSVAGGAVNGTNSNQPGKEGRRLSKYSERLKQQQQKEKEKEEDVIEETTPEDDPRLQQRKAKVTTTATTTTAVAAIADVSDGDAAGDDTTAAWENTFDEMGNDDNDMDGHGNGQNHDRDHDDGDDDETQYGTGIVLTSTPPPPHSTSGPADGVSVDFDETMDF